MTSEAVREIVRQELARSRRLEQFTGIVSGVDPLTVQLNSGADVHVSHRPAGMQLAVGDFVTLQYTGEVFLVHNLAVTSDSTSDAPAHHHDATYQPVSDGGLRFLGSAAGNNVITQLRVSWANDTRIRHLIVSGRVDLGTATSVGVPCQFRVNDDAGANYSIRRVSATGDAAFTTWQGADNDTELNFQVGDAGGGIIAHLFDIQNIADVTIDLRTRARWGSGTGSQRIDYHESLYKLAGPITSVLINCTSGAWADTAAIRVWGLLDPNT